jgi:hypothetical protein
MIFIDGEPWPPRLHGHANNLSNDYSSTAYWYQAEPHKPFPSFLPVEERLPRPEPAPTL